MLFIKGYVLCVTLFKPQSPPEPLGSKPDFETDPRRLEYLLLRSFRTQNKALEGIER